MAAIFGEGKTFSKSARVEFSDTLWVENFAEIALSRTVKEIEANFGGGENFWKIAKSTLLRYPVGWKFRRNRSISHG